jgi:hypothetical protein
MIDAINSEAIFYSATYGTKAGWKITLAVPDDEVPKQLDAIGAGKRFMLALVPIGDDEQPEPIIRPKGSRLAKRAGIICNQPSFWKWVNGNDWNCVTEGHAAAYIRNACGVNSRADLDHDEAAGKIFESLLAQYELWMRS